MRRSIVPVVAVFLAACSSPSTTTTVSPSGPPARLRVAAPPGATLGGFSTKSLQAPAGNPITIVFRNADRGVDHNVQIYAGVAATGTPVFAPPGNAMIAGPASATYVVGALPAGTYTFDCFAHPATMVGTLTVG